MYYRRKILLSLLEVFNKNLQHTNLQKLLFLLSQKQSKPSFQFVPYKYGCFSFSANQDLLTLSKYGIISNERISNKEIWTLESKETFIDQIKREDRLAIQSLKRQFDQHSTKDLIRYTYLNFPYYTLKSKIVNNILTSEELNYYGEIDFPKETESRLFTIGYEGISLETYLNRLIKNNIKLLCDIRKNSFSMKYGFSKKQLMNACENLDIQFVHIPQLGIVSEKRKKLQTQKDYENLFNEYEKTILIENHSFLLKIPDIISKFGRIALTCFEKDACMCHRGRVVKRLKALPEWTIPITHL